MPDLLVSQHLELGLGILTGQALTDDPRTIAEEYRKTVDLATVAESVGFDSVWLSEHHGAHDGYFPSLFPVLAAIAGRTTRLRLGTAVLIPALHNPLRLAEDAAVVDLLSEGRLIVGLGLGWRSREFRDTGVEAAKRVGMTVDTIELLRLLWRGEPVSFEGRVHRFDGSLALPTPYHPGGPPILLAGSSERPIRRAAAIADGLLYSRSGPTAAFNQPDIDALTTVLGMVRDTRGPVSAAAPDPFSITLITNAFAGDGDPWDTIGPGIDHAFTTYETWKAEERGEDVTTAQLDKSAAFGRNLTLVGSPATVVAGLGRWVDHLAAKVPLRLVVRLHYPGMKFEASAGAIETFGKEVAPALRDRAAAAVRHHSQTGVNLRD